MPRPRSLQECVHWLEVGEGARWIWLTATLIGVLLLSFRVAWVQFRGAGSEATVLQADVGRQLASGRGFTTLVNYPQTAAFLEKRGVRFDARQPYPELHQAPLYSLVIAGALRALPAGFRESLFVAPAAATDGYRGDAFLLGLNLGLFWLAVWLTFDLARRLFDARTGWLAALALLLSLPAWQQVMAVNGTALLMVLGVGAFWIWARVEHLAAAEEEPPPDAPGAPVPAGRPAAGERNPLGYFARGWSGRGGMRRGGWLAALGAACGLLFLTEYSAGLLLAVALGYGAWRFAGRARWAALALILVGFAAVSVPWIARNVALTGHPVALAAQNVALKAGDPTAEPATQRATLAAEGREIDLNKLGNKTLTSLQDSLQARVWSGGAMWLMAFFAAGWLYAFRSPVANRLRWIFTAALAVLLVAQAALNSGESERLAAIWLAPLVIVFGAGFFFVLLGSNAVLGPWPRGCAAALLVMQALPLVHDLLAPPPAVRFQYPPYYPGLFHSMRQELESRDHVGRFGIMADVPAGVAWYGRQRVWAQPVKLRDFYAITLEQPLAELLLTPRTLDRPFFTELATRPVGPDSLGRMTNRFGEWGRIYAGLFTGVLPPEFPLNAPQRLAENLYVMLNPALPPAGGK